MISYSLADTWIDPVVSSRVCLTLAHSLWQFALLAGGAWLVSRGLRRVASQYALHAVALAVGLIALPVTYSLVSVPSAVVRNAELETTQGRALPSSEGDRAGHSRASHEVAARSTTAQPMAAVGSATSELPNVARAEAQKIKEAPAASIASRFVEFFHRHATWIVGGYALGVMLMLVRLARGLWHAQRLARAGSEVADPQAVQMFAALVGRLQRRWSLQVTPVLRQAELVVVPQVVGLLRPTILLPASALTGLTAEELEMILAHELAHVRRADLWVNLLQRVAEAVLFFNPGLWVLSRRVSVLREYCCDELACEAVAGSSVNSNDAKPELKYAMALLQVVELQQSRRGRGVEKMEQVAALAASGRSPSELRRRVARLCGEPIREPLPLGRGGMWATLALISLMFAGPLLWSARAEDPLEAETRVAEPLAAKPVAAKPQAAGEELGASREVSTEEIVPGERVGDFVLGESTLQQVLGEDTPANRRKFDKRGLTFEFDEGRELKGVVISKPGFQTAAGIGVGSTLDELRAAYPDVKVLAPQGGKFRIRLFELTGIQFHPVEGEQIKFIRVFTNKRVRRELAKERMGSGDEKATLSGKIVLEDGTTATAKGWLYSDVRFLNGNSASGTEDSFVDEFSVKLGAGTAYLTYHAEGYAPVWTEKLELAPGEQREDLTLVLKPGSTQEVQVVNSDGEPIAGATLVAHPEIHGQVGGPVHKQQTDTNGKHVFQHLADTRYSFWVQAPGYEPLRELRELTPGESIKLEMTAALKTTGVVQRESDLAPVVGAKVYLKHELRHGGANRAYGNTGDGYWGELVATTDELGKFTLDQLAVDSSYLTVIEGPDGSRGFIKTITANQSVQIVIPPRRDLVVRVRGDMSQLRRVRGKAVLNVRQRVNTKLSGNGEQPSHTHGDLLGGRVEFDPAQFDGTVRFEGLAVDFDPEVEEQQVEVYLYLAEGGRLTKRVAMNLRGDTEVEFELPGGELEY